MANVKVIAPQTFQPEHLRVAAYCRVSSDSRDQLHSYAAQIRSYTEEIAQHDGWELVDVYADDTDILGLKSELQQRSASLVQFLCAERRKTNEKRGEKTDGKWAGPVEGTARFNSRKP